jgi:hypothetical protein
MSARDARDVQVYHTGLRFQLDKLYQYSVFIIVYYKLCADFSWCCLSVWAEIRMLVQNQVRGLKVEVYAL